MASKKSCEGAEKKSNLERSVASTSPPGLAISDIAPALLPSLEDELASTFSLICSKGTEVECPEAISIELVKVWLRFDIV